MKFKKLILASAVSCALPFSAMAEDLRIGVSMSYFDDNFLTIMRTAMQEELAALDGVEAQFEDAKGDVAQQIQHVESFISQDLDVIIVNPVDTQAVTPIIRNALASKAPLLFLGKKPEVPLPEGVPFIGSESVVAGQLQMEYLAEKMGGKGKLMILLGELNAEATRERTRGVESVVAKYPDIEIVDRQTAKYFRKEAVDVTSNWILSGHEFDAIASNNDEMAIGAIMALRQAGKEGVLVGGVDATPDALAFMDKGMLDVTVFQDAKGQASAAIDTAVKMAKGEKVDQEIMIPFRLVTPDNYKEFIGMN
ncbi:sugar ABC transporter substrate-binding protein [Zobellella sp. DQSA1]|uniref:sugar ABC transporter substrate-binding protein n=1 Tax=Zobellella sp. DQSA1 TaxID=3342386 RepID=UPI0035C175C7